MRYFIIFFEGTNNEDEDGSHKGHIATRNEIMPPYRALNYSIRELYNLDQVIITGMLEVSKEDYDNWILNDEPEDEQLLGWE